MRASIGMPLICKTMIDLGLIAVLALPATALEAPVDHNPALVRQMADLTVPFVANAGQIENPDVLFSARTLGGVAYVLKGGGIHYALPKYQAASRDPSTTRGYHEKSGFSNGKSAIHNPQSPVLTGVGVICEKLVNAAAAAPVGEQKALTKITSFVGNRAQWKTGLASYQSVNLGEVYQDVTLRLRAHGDNVEKVFTVAPGGDPAEIELAVEGVTCLRLDASGELIVGTELGEVRFSAPVAYQWEKEQRRAVAARYVVSGTRYGFEVGAYDETRPLVIDPLLASTFLGGSYYDYGNALVVVNDAAVYVAGETTSYNFPVSVGAYQTSLAGAGDVFVSKLDSSLTQLVASTYIGGSDNDWGAALALDGAGNVYITGRTDSTNYPATAGAYDTTHNGTNLYDPDAYISKLSGDLAQLVASTYLGGSDLDQAYGLVLDSATNVYVTGYSISTNYPVTVGAYSTNRVGVFVSKLDRNLTQLSASTFIGLGSGQAIARDSADRIYITGNTSASNFPTTSGAYNRTPRGSYDAFVSVLNSALSQLQASTLLGGISADFGYALAIDTTSNIYMVGYTMSTDYPTTSGAYDRTFRGQNDVVVSKLNSALSQLLASTLLGGSSWDYGYALALDNAGHAFVAGRADSSDFPVTAGAYSTVFGGGNDAFIARFNDTLTQLQASTYLGGTQWDYAYGIALGNGTNVYVVGYTGSSDFPVTAGAYATNYHGYNEVFISKLDIDLSAALETPLGVLEDYDADGKCDPAVFQESTGIWSVKMSAGGYAISLAVLGGTGYTPLSGDFDGDGKGDLAVYQESTGLWGVMLSGSGYATATTILGGAGYAPLSGDFDGDGQTDPAVYQESSGLWQVMLSASGYATASAILGSDGCSAIPGDFDGDGKADPGVYQEATGLWGVMLSGSGYSTATAVLGSAGYRPVSGDYDGDRKADLMVYRESIGAWDAMLSASGYASMSLALGGPATRAASGDFDGDGKTDPAVFNQANSLWYVKLSGSGYATVTY